MNKWIVSAGIIATSIGVIFWAMAPMLVAYAQMVPDVNFEVGNKASIEVALIQVEINTTSYFREIYGDSIFAVSLLAVANGLFAIWLLFKSK